MKNEYISREIFCEKDGKKIYGVEYVPQIEGGKMPCVILSHGYNSSYADVIYTADLLARDGIVTYCFDFCGGSTRSKSSGSSLDMSIKTEISDLVDVIEMVKGFDGVDVDNIYLYGESQGGFVSALTSVEKRDEIAGLILIYPAFCIPYDWDDKKADKSWEKAELMGMELSRKFVDELPEYDVYDYISQYDRPVMIFHGDADTLVDLNYSQRLVKAFPDASLEVIENGGHGFYEAARIHIANEIISFVTEDKE